MISLLSRDEAPRPLTSEEARQKREIYERMHPRRRKFVDRLGYDTWDPFQKPKEPMELRTDPTGRTTQQLFREFLQARTAVGPVSNASARAPLSAPSA